MNINPIADFNPQNTTSQTIPPPAELPLLKLRDDVQFTYQSYGQRPCYLLEDALHGHFFQLGILEYQFIQQLQGNTPIPVAIQMTEGMTEIHAKTLCQWLIQNQLVYVQTADKTRWILPNPPTDIMLTLSKRLNWLFIKIPLGSPDRTIERLLPFFRWTMGKGFLAIWLLVITSGLYWVFSQSERFFQSAGSLLLYNNIIWLILAWILIKVIHEFAHGLVCKYYGGSVHQAGVLLILFAPIGMYVDANTTWRLTSRLQRIHVTAAGMYVELFIAGIAAWIWAYTDTGILNYFAYNLMITTSISTILFNANPLMRFDGYYILSDIIDIPNLYIAAQRYTHYLNRRYLQGRKEKCPVDQLRYPVFIKIYAIAAWIWRWLMIIGLIVAANHLFQGLGIILTALTLITLVIFPFLRFFRQMRRDAYKKQVILYSFMILLISSFILSIGFTQFTWSVQHTAPAVFDYAGETVLRAETAGLIKSIYIEPNQSVKEGDLLLELENNLLLAEERDLQLKAQITELRRQRYLTQDRRAEAQAEAEKLKDVQSHQTELALKIKQLRLYAPHAGVLVAPHLKERLHTFLQRGEAIAIIANPQKLELQLSIPQEDIETFQVKNGNLVTVYRHSQPLTALMGHLTQVKPTASWEILHPALTVLGGGYLTVKPRNELERNNREEELEYTYLSPRFVATVELPAAALQGVRVGETAWVALASPPQTGWYYLSTTIQRYFQRLNEQAESLQN